VNGALEAVKDVRFSANADFKGFVVIVSADFTFWHGVKLLCDGLPHRRAGGRQANSNCGAHAFRTPGEQTAAMHGNSRALNLSR
jgi:hypothetical protein